MIFFMLAPLMVAAGITILKWRKRCNPTWSNDHEGKFLAGWVLIFCALLTVIVPSVHIVVEHLSAPVAIAKHEALRDAASRLKDADYMFKDVYTAAIDSNLNIAKWRAMNESGWLWFDWFFNDAVCNLKPIVVQR